ncbi:MAG: ThuA domain-containing protein [Halioglobus sp.]
MKKIFAWLGVVVAVLVVAGGIGVARFFGFILVDLDDTPPVIPIDLARPAVLVFSKANGFVHVDALPAGKTMLENIAAENGWGIFQTENGAVMAPELLEKFDVIVWNNTSGTTLSEQQQSAFKDYLEQGGGFVGIHAAGGDPWYSWKWYVNDLIGAQFIGHTMDPHFQDADVLVLESADPIVAHLPSRWRVPAEEWYGFDSSARDKGHTVLLALDEETYDPNNSGMEGEHPSTWKRDIGQGRMFYTAIGHQAATYDLPEFREMVEKAISWAGNF